MARFTLKRVTDGTSNLPARKTVQYNAFHPIQETPSSSYPSKLRFALLSGFQRILCRFDTDSSQSSRHPAELYRIMLIEGVWFSVLRFGEFVHGNRRI